MLEVFRLASSGLSVLVVGGRQPSTCHTEGCVFAMSGLELRRCCPQKLSFRSYIQQAPPRTGPVPFLYKTREIVSGNKNTGMQTPFHTVQDQFDELRLQVTDFEFTDKLSSIEAPSTTTQRSETRAMEIDAMLYLLEVFGRPKRRTVLSVAPVFLSFTTGGITSLPQQPQHERPPPSRYIRRSRAAGPRPLAN